MLLRIAASLVIVLPACGMTHAQDSLLEKEQAAFKAAAEQVAPSVVQIETIGGLDRVDDTLIGDGPTTGLIVSADGYVVTSAFAFAARPSAAVVLLADGRKLEAEIVATDFNRMLALLKVDADSLPVPEAAPPDEARVGQWTLAVGKIFDPAVPNVSPGILSARQRVWGKAIQTDAKVSPFNYGGPLIDIRGRVLGVIVPLSMTSDTVMAGAAWYDSGIGFAIPYDQVLAALERLRSGEDQYPGTLGIIPAEAGNLFAPPTVDNMRKDGPAAAAGVKKGDLILAIDGVTVEHLGAVKRQLGPRYAGEEVQLTLRRDGEEVSLAVTLGKRAETSIIPQREAIPQPGEAPGEQSPSGGS